MSKRITFLIIGAGISGLHLGALLSQYGQVIIFEKSHNVGGRARVEDIQGFNLDFGIHIIRFGSNSALGASLKELDCKIEFIKPGKSWVYMRNGKRILFPTGGLWTIVKSKFVPTMKTIKLLLKVKRIDDIHIKKMYNLSLNNWFEREKIDPQIRNFLILISSAIQVNPFPERSSTGELLKNIKRVLEKGSIFYPNGGWNYILNGLIKKIKENKGDIRLKTPISKIIIENNKAVGVRVNNQTIIGDFIISTIPVQNLFSILDENLCEPNFVSKCKNLRQTAGISIDFGLSQKISDVDGMIFFEKFLSFGLIPSNLSPKITPKHKSLMTFLTVVNREDILNKERANTIYKEFRKEILSHFPKIEDYLLFERALFLEMVDGVEINTEQHQFKRPGNKVKEIKNLFITGDSVGGEGSGGDVGHTSVRECYSKILQKIK